MTDPIADMIIRIKNALLAKHKEVVVPHSGIKLALAKILQDHNYIISYGVTNEKPQPNIKITLRYVDGDPAISGVKRLSKPGRRMYCSADKIPSTLKGYGITVVSTNKGMMVDAQARKKQVGGELICQIW